MKLFKFAAESGRAVTQHNSQNCLFSRIMKSEEAVFVGAMSIGPNGVVGQHEAVCSQLFFILQGSGWVSGKEDKEFEVSAGDAVLWDKNEVHRTRSDRGLTAMIIEGNAIEVLLDEVQWE